MTQQQVADALNIRLEYVSLLEHGRRCPSLPLATELIQLLRISSAEVMAAVAVDVGKERKYDYSHKKKGAANEEEG
jgi:DNA-binding XRE family transcriptional regulator